MKERFKRKTFTVIAVPVVALFGVVLLVVSPGPSASTIKETRLFCQRIERGTLFPDLMQRAGASAEKGIRADVVEESKVLIRLHNCHCWVSFQPTGTEVSEVVCNS
ncbi:hypothetical protein [Hydrogenophaga sp. RWCD_12]|uniref:hypothetical protein n=1 Tax=Hydrogenophaga sp. RWCD_12 TaxID=3391190 RepID=UPI0039854B44